MTAMISAVNAFVGCCGPDIKQFFIPIIITSVVQVASAIFLVVRMDMQYEELEDRQYNLEELIVVNGCGDQYTVVQKSLIDDIVAAIDTTYFCYYIGVAIALLPLVNIASIFVEGPKKEEEKQDYDEDETRNLLE